MKKMAKSTAMKLIFISFLFVIKLQLSNEIVRNSLNRVQPHIFLDIVVRLSVQSYS